MRRISTQQGRLFTFLQKRDSGDKKKLSVGKPKCKVKPNKPKNQQTINHKHLKHRKTKSYLQKQSNQSSTHYTIKTKKTFGREKKTNLKKYQKEIMEVLNKSALLIQRQWRKYLIRKYKKIIKDKDSIVQSFQKSSEKREGSISIDPSQTQSFNRERKYFSYNSTQNFKRYENMFEFNSSEKKFIEEMSSDNKKSSLKLKHLRSCSDMVDLLNRNTINQSTISDKRSMNFQTNTVNLTIENARNKKYEESYIHGDKKLMQKVIKKYQRKLQNKKIKQILSLENRFKNNLMTFRSYEKSVDEISEEHNKKLTLLKLKKTKIFNNFNEIIELYNEEDTSQILPLNLSQSDFSAEECPSSVKTSIQFEEWNPGETHKCTQILIKQNESSKQLTRQKGVEKSQQLFPQNQVVTFEVQALMQDQKKQSKSGLSTLFGIDHTNQWLLQISHYILDHCGEELYEKLVHIKQPEQKTLLRYCRNEYFCLPDYQTISQKMFNSFQQIHINKLLSQNKISTEYKKQFSVISITYHKCLHDSLNDMLLDELIEGRNWISYPWKTDFKVKKLITSSFTKQALEKAINRVSINSDYELYPMEKTYKYGNQNEHLHQDLIIIEEIKAIPLESEIEIGFVLMRVSEMIIDTIMMEEMFIVRIVCDASFIN